MLRRALRAVLFAIVTIALWTVARPAQAMPAGFCDDRGASAIAPDPLLEAPDVAIQRARIAPTCDGEEVQLGAAVAPGHGQPPIASASADPALPAATPAVPPASFDLCTFAPVAQPRADGVTSTLDRPPRG
jgi:hypothetical protein